jgi:transcription factor CP2-like protein
MASGWTLEDLDEATLTAELSGMAGLGSELGRPQTAAVYNMSDVLGSLDMFKSEAGYQSPMSVAAPGLQFIFGAPTSPACRVGEETLTNINRGRYIRND